MIRLERNILDQANVNLRELEEHVLAPENVEGAEAKTVYGRLETLFSLAKLKDSGMSDECAGMLEEIERRAKIVAARLEKA
ncbi:hypothetical protein [Salinicola rhizosphaerae]|uniref:Uncharacterized protein n=1 Tax=Salinicola rhizosphaerae TaxID=1443141 RepID=A0ABQ3DZ86_9GAMM|nr:hypothetical protein [Salinicola rhizosphaerae]GHB20487.1 hypothetical protein GCM10009038_19050 [Salinicola rhizosphaerae]